MLGLRLNVWTSIVVFLIAAGFFLWLRRRGDDPDPIHLPGHGEAATVATTTPVESSTPDADGHEGG